MKGIFYPENYSWDVMELHVHQVRHPDPEKDRRLPDIRLREEGMTTEKVRDFCQEMIAVHGRFAEEAGDILEGQVEEFPDKGGYRDLLEKAGKAVKKWYEGWKG